MEINKVFDFAHNFSEKVHLLDELRRINIKLVKRCGDCKKWMTQDCVPEITFKIFKTCNDLPCRWFIQSQQSVKTHHNLQQQLNDIKDKL